MLAGLSAALGAGLLWGLVFLTPLLLADYPPFMLAIGRYLAFGVLALGLAWFDRAALARLTRADWIEAVKLALVGNLVYYATLASAIQLAGGPVPTLIIGTLPVVIAITANL
ncbi:MAG TPA: EamA family transporter, partial [Thauera aminoaromatica]|nr:EamA family transporter [Thauera aminoaromatica]